MSEQGAHEQASTTRSFYVLQCYRVFIATLLTIFLAISVDFGTPTSLLVTAVILGILVSGRYLRRKTSLVTCLAWHVVFAAAMYLLIWIAQSVQLNDDSASPFTIFRLAEHIWLLFSFYGFTFLLSWFFWTRASAVTIEATSISVLFVYLLGAHRNYQLDAPKNIMRFAWENPIAQVAPQHLLLGLGIAYTLALLVYLILAHERPIFGAQGAVVSPGKARIISGVTVFAVFIVGMIGFAFIINQSYSTDLSRASNGVGTDKNAEGDSPLGFHSAVGKTRQPSALVRLETQYDKNPWTPMLYLREEALSTFNGRELVIAPKNFDIDVPRIRPGQPFIGTEREVPDNRARIVHSVYLLTKHKSLFAIDFPHMIRLIENPEPDKFSMAYQAVSYAPTIPLATLIGEEVGNPNWNEQTWAHYLRAPGSRDKDKELEWEAQYAGGEPVLDQYSEDLRYKAFANRLSAGSTTPVQKVISIVEYLSEESLYTRKPGHTISQSGDPVAPYLFSEEMRGYCVHFAHAAVYLFRLLGIPARIATGYLTDLTYAKDGHVLLHLGDRHAWPEIYVRGIGWVVADITPANAENEEPIVPDESLLEELMDKLDPAHELVEPPPIAPEDLEEKSLIDRVATKQNVFAFFLSAFLAYILLKLWLRFGWLLARSDESRAIRAYIAFASLASDIGYSRRIGETRIEYSSRLKRQGNLDFYALTSLAERVNYQDSPRIHRDDVDAALQHARGSFNSTQSLAMRSLAFISPLSIKNLWRM